jgi:DNA repair protein RadC
MIGNVLMTESFSSTGKRHYFLDFKRTSRDSKFIQISRSDQLEDGSYRRTFVIIFEQDFEFLISAMSSLFHHSAHLSEDGKTIYQTHRDNKSIRERGIPSWDPEVKPREKLMAHGAGSLEDKELLAILIGSGTPGEDAVVLSGRILKAFGGFAGFFGRSVSALCRFNGIGEAKASTILTVMEIVKRISGR